MWIPSLIGGAAYAHHDGPIQANDGSVTDNTRSSLFAGVAPLAYYNVTDAIFAPLAKRQDALAQRAGVQTVTNDTLTAVAVAYFDAQEARADLASIEEISRLMAALVRKTEKLAPELAPEVELARVRALQKNIEQARITARMQWRIVSAELARVLRLPPTVIVQPIEPPDLRMTLIPLSTTAEEMIPLAQRLRPELTQYQAQVAAAEERLRQERFRPFLPNIAVRGGTTPTANPLGAGGYAAGQGGSLGTMGLRSDWDLEAIWELKNLGFGNAALVRERRAAVDLRARPALPVSRLRCQRGHASLGATARRRRTHSRSGRGTATGVAVSNQEPGRTRRNQAPGREHRHPRHSSARSHGGDAIACASVLQLLWRHRGIQSRSIPPLSGAR